VDPFVTAERKTPYVLPMDEKRVVTPCQQRGQLPGLTLHTGQFHIPFIALDLQQRGRGLFPSGPGFVVTARGAASHRLESTESANLIFV
jgi:hypothetical protein